MQHPNIATLHDAGTSAKGRPYFVMEYVDGLPITAACDQRCSTIAERLALLAEVCRAVEHAHRKGVVHRDLKPANVVVTERDGRLTPKVVDFGIAKAAGMHSTGRTMATGFGELLGTPEYMSPEQAAGAAIGPASDIYSLGVMLYELLAGVLPFDPAKLRDLTVAEAAHIIGDVKAPTPASRLAETDTAADLAHLRQTDVATLRRALSRDLARVLSVCLEKDPQLRYPSAAALADDIERYLRNEPMLARGARIGYRLRKRLRRYGTALAGMAVAAPALALIFWFTRSQSYAPLEVTPLTTYRGSETSPSFSPDAKEVVFAWNGEHEDNWDIYRLRIGTAEPRRLTFDPAMEYSPAWSPDGKWIAFLRSPTTSVAQLMLMPESGGGARQLLTTTFNIDPRRRRLAWSPDSRWLVLAHKIPNGQQQRLFAISAATGEERQVAGTEYPASMSDGQPAISPDGRALLFARDAETPGQIWTLPLTADLRAAGPQRRVSIPGLNNKECGVPIFLSSREMLFSAPVQRGRGLLRGSVSGNKPPTELAELGANIDTPEVSRDGRKLIFIREAFDTNIWCLHLDAPAGREVRRERVIASTLRDQNPSMSPDGRTLAFESNRGGFYEIWLASLEGSNLRQLTSFGALTSSPRWSPDGQQIAFDGNKTGKADVYVIPAAGGTPRQLVSDPTDTQQPIWSPDGKWIYYCSMRSGQREIWRIPANGGTPQQVTRHGGFDIVFSPDQRWIYYSRLRASSTSIWRMSTDSGEEQKLIDSASWGHVSATTRRLYYNRSLNGTKCHIEAYDLATGRTKVLATTDRPIRDRLAVTNDERSIYFTQVDDDGVDLMLVSNFH
jgi:Tol biopolymer transport system component